MYLASPSSDLEYTTSADGLWFVYLILSFIYIDIEIEKKWRFAANCFTSPDDQGSKPRHCLAH